MGIQNVTLKSLEADDRELFISDNQAAFLFGAVEEFGLRDNHFEEDGQIISRKTIENSLDAKNSEAYRIFFNGEKSGGAVIRIDSLEKKGSLDLFFVSPDVHGKGIGYSAWLALEKLHPEIKIWETVTPYFEKRNIHFYVNKCGFKITEFFNKYHSEIHHADDNFEMFRFEKVIH